jgi:PAS domain S-box-containing protein
MALPKSPPELEELRARLAEAEETLNAIRQGEVDALVVSGPQGEQIYTLRGADYSSRMLLQEMNEGALTLLADGTILYCNPRFADMLKLPHENVIGASASQFVVSENQQLFETLLRQGEEEGIRAPIDFSAADGTVVPAYCSVNPVKLDQTHCLSIIVTNLTEQKRNEKILASERLANSILEQAAEMIVVCEGSGTIIRASRAVQDFYGRNLLYERFNDLFEIVAADEMALSCSVDEAGVERRSTILDSCLGGTTIRALEVQLRRPDGTMADMLLSAAPLRDFDEQAMGCIFTFSDISKMRQAEAALRSSESQLATELSAMSRLHELSTHLINTSDLQTALSNILNTVIDLLRADMGNVQLYDPESQTLEIVAQKGFAQDFLDYFRRVGIHDGTTCSRSMQSGERIIIEDIESDRLYAPHHAAASAAGYRAVQSTPLKSAAGQFLGVLSAHFRQPHRPSANELKMLDLYARQAADFIERLRIEENLRASEQKSREESEALEQQLIASGRLVSLGEVAASMAHEFNNPLGIIIGFIEEIIKGKQPTDPDYRALQIIDEESRRCHKIVKDLMDYARPQNSEKSALSIQPVIEKTLSLVETHFYKKKITPETDIQPHLPEIYADSQQLAQVLINLYLNAIDAMPGGGTLTVTAKTEDSDAITPAVVITVADTGFGIDREELARVFRPFYTAKKKRGLGLGLPICERIVKNHGGSITVESAINKGSTFRIRLPVKYDSNSSIAGESQPHKGNDN